MCASHHIFIYSSLSYFVVRLDSSSPTQLLCQRNRGDHRPHIVHFTTYNHMCSIDFTRWLFFIQFASYLNYCVLHSNINRRGVISMTFSQSKISVRPFMLAWVQTLLLTSTFPPKKLTEEIDDQSWVCFDSINMTSSYLVAIYHGVGICYICQSIY